VHSAAVGLRSRAGVDRPIAERDGFISPLDLVGIGLVSAEEAKEMHDLETSSATAATTTTFPTARR
jgi:hypothetical protein